MNKTMNVEVVLEHITPEQAKELLEANTANRNMRSVHVDRIASDITAGRWQMNGATIVFSADGTLLDGQHRLAAIVKSGITIPMMIVRGVSGSVMPTIDSNISRKAADVAKLQGYTQVTRLVATTRMLMLIKTDSVDPSRKTGTGDVLALLERHPQLSSCVADAEHVRQIIPPSIVAAWLYLARYNANEPDLANRALNTLVTGVPSYSGDPIHTFRERMISMPKGEHHHMTGRYNVTMTLIAMWNDYREGRRLTMCKLRRSGVKMAKVDYDEI